MITEEQLYNINEQIYNLESAYNACVTYIEHINEQIIYNDRLFENMQIMSKEYNYNKRKLQKERSKAFDEAKVYHKKAFFLKKKARDLQMGCQYI